MRDLVSDLDPRAPETISTTALHFEAGLPGVTELNSSWNQSAQTSPVWEKPCTSHEGRGKRRTEKALAETRRGSGSQKQPYGTAACLASEAFLNPPQPLRLPPGSRLPVLLIGVLVPVPFPTASGQRHPSFSRAVPPPLSLCTHCSLPCHPARCVCPSFSIQV